MSCETCAPARDELRILKLLNRAGGTGMGSSTDGSRTVLSGVDRAHSFPAAFIGELERRGLIASGPDRVAISPEGAARLKRLLHPDEPHLAQNRDLKQKQVETAAGHQAVLVNEAESPLARLHARRDRNGHSWIDAWQFQAGERLRSDFEKAGLQPRISANWEASVASRGRSGAETGEIAGFALDARNRFNRALEAVGPELSGVTVDICCFLYGLEQVERARKWPPRSAKLMLRTALDMLVRHYGLKTGTGTRKTRQWGSEDYRPEIGCRENG